MLRSRFLLSTAAVSLIALGLSLHPAAAQQRQQNDTSRPANDRNAGAKVSSTDYTKKAAMTDMFEIEAAKLALEKSRNDGVKRFAQHMIDEHTKMSSELKSAAKAQPPASLDREHQGKLDQLRKESGANFDRKYMEMQVKGHQDALRLNQNYAQSGDDAGLKKVANDAVPHVQQHLQQAQQLQRQTAEAPRGEQQQQRR